MGAERPPYGASHARFSPAGDHFAGKPFSEEIPSRAGPRQSAQSLADTEITAARRKSGPIARREKGDGVFIFLSTPLVSVKYATRRLSVALRLGNFLDAHTV